MKKFLKFLFVVTILLLTFTLALRFWAKIHFKGFQYSTVEELPLETPPRIGIVLGAGIWPGNILSPAAMDRVKTGAELYQSGKIKKIILSGDNRRIDYNEPEAMKRAILLLGVSEEDVILDFAGRHTYDSCYRAKEIFNVTRTILITQPFHMDRALYICKSLGIDSIGLKSPDYDYGKWEIHWKLREIPAFLKAWIALNLYPPSVILGKAEPIY